MSVGVNNGFSNEPASLYSPMIPLASSTCQFKFWYTFVGSSGSLSVSLYINEDQKVVVYKKEANPPATVWTQGVANLGSVSNRFQMIFEAKRTLNSFGYVSIDDASFENCNLPFLNSTCSPNEFKCKRGNCVSMDRTCDFVDDCGDYSDEILPTCSSYQK